MDIFCCSETWSSLEELQKFNWYTQLISQYEVICFDALKVKKMGRKSSGFLIGVSKRKFKTTSVTSTETTVQLTIQALANRRTLNIHFVYFSPSVFKNATFENYINNVTTYKPDYIIGDFNARVKNDNTSNIQRKSKDNKINKRGEYIIKYLGDYVIGNGCIKGDEMGECTFVNKRGSSVVDLILIPKSNFHQVQNLKVNYTEQSFHSQVIITIGKESAKSTVGSKVKKIKWVENKRLNFLQKLHQQRLEPISSFQKLNKLIYDSAKFVGLKTECEISKRFGGPVWMDRELHDAKLKYRRTVTKFRRADALCDSFKFKYCKNEMLRAKEQYLQISNSKKVKFFSDIQKKLLNANDSKGFWSALDFFRKSGKKADCGEIKLEDWKQHFENVFRSAQSSVNIEPSNNLEDPNLDAQFNMFDLVMAIKKLSKQKAPGSDGIPNEVWKALTLHTKRDLLNLFNSVYSDPSQMPASWSEITIVPIFKKGDVNLPNNYRPISLINTVTKLFTTMLTTRLDKWCTKNKKISEFQAGFRSGTGCVEQAFVLNTLIQNQLRNKNSRLFCMFVDLSQAFDSVEHNILWKKLNEKGLSTKFINVLRQLYSMANAQVRVEGKFTDKFKIEKSVLQGESLSPKLFTLFIDDVTEHIENSAGTSMFIDKHNVDLLLFADDIALLAFSARDLQIKIDAIKCFFEANNLKVNLSKTKVVIFRRKRAVPACQFNWGDEKIEIVDHYTYLGIPFHFSGKFELAFTTQINKAKQAQSTNFKLFCRGKIRNFAIQDMLFNSLCRSVLMYGVVLWGLTFIDKLCIFQNQFIRKLFYLPNETPRYKLLLETACKPIESHVLKLLLKFVRRISAKPNDSLVKCCLVRLINIKTSETKYNWYSQYEHFMNHCNMGGIVKNLDLISNYQKINGIVKKFENRYKNETVATMISSSKQYALIKSKAIGEPYLNADISFRTKQLIFQMRCGNNQIYYKEPCDLLGNRKNGFKNCDICDSGIEDIYHVFCICKHYGFHRKVFQHETDIFLQNMSMELFNKMLADTQNIKLLNAINMYWRN